MHSRLTRQARSLTRATLVAGFISVVLVGCGKDEELCAEGSLDCRCDAKERCGEGLRCEDDLCVAKDAKEPDGASGASGTGAGDDPQGDDPNGEGGGGGAMSVDSPEPEDEEGAAGQGSGAAAGGPNGGHGGTGSGGGGGTDGEGSSGGVGGSEAGSGGSSGSTGGSGGETSQFPGSCYGCYVEFGCAAEHLACVSDPGCAPCVANGYSASACSANPTFQALMACACETFCQTPCAEVCE